MSDQSIKKEFSNKIIIIDEIHNIKTQANSDGEEKLQIYKEFWRMFHLIINSKILLLSGTPMTDNVDEIADVMNLLLPRDNQIPARSLFSQNFIQDNRVKEYIKIKILL